MPIQTRALYNSPNGDRWLLCRDTDTDRVFVRHEPNAASGGRISEIEIGTFLSRGPLNPEHQALLRLTATLVDDFMPRPVMGVSDDAVQPIVEFQHRWVEALLKADIAALELILVDSYVDTDESGYLFDKPAILAALKSGDLKLQSISLLQTRVDRYGDAAVLTGTSAQAGSFQGAPIAPRILFTATVILQSDNWRAVAAHRTAVPAN